MSGTISAKDQYIDDGKINAGKTGRDAVIGAAATGVAVAAVPVIAAGAKAWGQTLDEVVAAKVVSQAEVDAAALQAAKVGNNFGREADLIRTQPSKEKVAELIAEHSKQGKSAANASPLTQDGAKSILNEINPPGTTAKVMGDNAARPDIHIINSANGERRTANGERRTANGERRTANGERRTASSLPQFRLSRSLAHVDLNRR